MPRNIQPSFPGVARVGWKVMLLLWSGLCWGSGSSIYALMEGDGSVSLSNVPTDRRYTMLIGESGEFSRNSTAASRARSAGGVSKRGLYSSIIDRAANSYGLESALLHAVITAESAYDPAAVSKKGAGGLMQLMPGTARRYGVADAFDPEQNIDGGARYLRDLFKMFDSDLSLVLAAYNAGENAVIRNQNRIPNFRETLEYVPRVLANYHKYKNLAAVTDRTKRVSD